MNRAVYDTRFFMELYYSNDREVIRKIKQEKNRKERIISAAVIYEVYRLAIAREGRDIARIKVDELRNSFNIIPISDPIAEFAAELSHKYRLSMGDSIIAATAAISNAVCFTDDPHFQQIKEIKTTWL
jgi:predicted nucleic acid-binding protein